MRPRNRPKPEGDSAADYAVIYQSLGPKLMRVAMLMVGGDRPFAEDIVSAVFLKTYPKWQDGLVLNAGPYLRQAVIKQAMLTFRSLGSARHYQARQRSGESSGHAPDDQLADASVLGAALLLLPPKQRAAVVLRYYEDLSLEETAQVLKTTVGTVKKQVFRGLERLRTILEPQRGDW